MALQSADPAHLGATFPYGWATALGAAEVMALHMLRPSLLWVPQDHYAIGQVESDPVPVWIVRRVWGQLEAAEICLALLLGQQPLGLGLSPVVSWIIGCNDSPVYTVLR